MTHELTEAQALLIRAANARKVHAGQRVVCNGYPGTITKVCDGALLGMVEVRVPGGLVCVDIAEMNR